MELVLSIDAMAPNVGTLGCMPGNMANVSDHTEEVMISERLGHEEHTFATRGLLRWKRTVTFVVAQVDPTVRINTTSKQFEKHTTNSPLCVLIVNTSF
jgi:hypothetical protein